MTSSERLIEAQTDCGCSTNVPKTFVVWAALAIAVCINTLAPRPIAVKADNGSAVDTALIVSVDISSSVDASRYKLQMEGIAKALEDPSVLNAITAGPRGGILFSMVTWADQATMSIDWQRIANRQDARKIADLVRSLPQQGGEFTCLARMFHAVSERFIPDIPAPARRVVLDVSGDGIDNCSDIDQLRTERDDVLAKGATINGLPILVEGENDLVGSGAYRAPGFGLKELSRDPDHEITTLDQWYHSHVVGGPDAFLLPAHGYADFARALRQKFVTEISFLNERDPTRQWP